MGLGQEANNLKKEINRDIRSSGWDGLIFYGLFFLFLIGCVIYALGSWSESPVDPAEKTEPAVADKSEEDIQPEKKTTVKISENYYFALPEVADLKDEKKKDNVLTKTYYFFGKDDKSTLIKIITEKDDSDFPQVVWSRYEGGESELSYVMFYDTAAAIHQEEEVIECWWPDGGDILCHVKLTGGNIDGYVNEILNMIRKKGEPANSFGEDDVDGSGA